jgi:beta-lactam-binding protein with PASTA domain
MTLTGSIMGTAQYLSPEQAQGFAVSAASDLYSIGVILYELLTGVVPFEGETAVAIAFKQVSAEPRPPSELNPVLSPSLDAVVLRALAKDPAQRYADADELIAALQREREVLPALTGAPAATVYHAPAPVAPVGTGALLLAPAGAGPYGPSDELAPLEDRGARKRRLALWGVAAFVLLACAAVLALVLTQSNESVRVPVVTGQSEQAAGAALRSAGLNPVSSLASSTKVASDLVISQTPPAGSVVKKGARVSIVVSGGPASKSLMNVAGLSAAAAATKLRKAGLKTTTKSEPSKTVEAGQVIGTEPPAETEVQEGHLITLLVSSGPAPVRVPDVTGQSLEAAEATLSNSELALGAVTHKVSTTQAAGTVLSQSPAAGGSLHAGDKVNLTVARAPKEIAVPNVVGAAEAAAAAALKHAGFKVKTEPHATSEPAQMGVVLEQSPEQATKARKGTTVTIAIGTLTTPTTPTTPTTTPTTTTTTTTTTAPATPPTSE